jgi:hypothetical protein
MAPAALTSQPIFLSLKSGALARKRTGLSADATTSVGSSREFG